MGVSLKPEFTTAMMDTAVDATANQFSWILIRKKFK